MPEPSKTTPALPKMDLGALLLAEDKERSELDKIFELLLDPRNIAHNTELSKNEITAFSVLGTIAKRRPEFGVLRDFLVQNMTNRVSHDRKGRKEWVKITSRALSNEDQYAQMEQRNGASRWFRGNKR